MKQIIDGVWHIQDIPYDEHLLKFRTPDVLIGEYMDIVQELKATTSGDVGWKRNEYGFSNEREEGSGALWHFDAMSIKGVIHYTVPRNYMLLAPLCQKPFEGRETLVQDQMGFVAKADPWNIYLIRWNIRHKGPSGHTGPRLIKRHYLWIDDRSFDSNYSEG